MKHWEDPSNEAVAMSVLPFWEIYHSGQRDALRIKEGKLRTTGHFKSTVTAEQRRIMQDEGWLRNRALMREDIKPDMEVRIITLS